MNILGPQLQRQPECEAVLRSLPEWFGIEESLRRYVQDSARLPTFALEHAGAVVGFISLRQHFAESWEVHCIAVAAAPRNKGYGSVLLAHAESWLQAQSVRFLQIKTIAEGRVSASYAQTREFYRARGYSRLEVFPTLWSPSNPVLQLVKRLGSS